MRYGIRDRKNMQNKGIGESGNLSSELSIVMFVLSIFTIIPETIPYVARL